MLDYLHKQEMSTSPFQPFCKMMKAKYSGSRETESIYMYCTFSTHRVDYLHDKCKKKCLQVFRIMEDTYNGCCETVGVHLYHTQVGSSTCERNIYNTSPN